MSTMNRRPGDRIVHLQRTETLQSRGRHRSATQSFLRGILVPQQSDEESVKVLLLKCLVVLVALAVTTWALWMVRDSIGLLNIGLIYLIVVIAATVWGGL